MTSLILLTVAVGSIFAFAPPLMAISTLVSFMMNIFIAAIIITAVVALVFVFVTVYYFFLKKESRVDTHVEFADMRSSRRID